MNKNTEKANAKSILGPILTVLLFATFITACGDLESSKDKPSAETNTPPEPYAGTYTIDKIKDSDGKDLSVQFTDISVRGTTAKFTIMGEDGNGDDLSQEFTLPVKNGIAKEVALIPIVINFTDIPVYYRIRIVHDGMGDERENYTLAIVTNTDKSALDDATYPAAEYTALQTLEKNKITIPLPDQDSSSKPVGTPKRDSEGRPILEIITGTITKK